MSESTAPQTTDVELTRRIRSGGEAGQSAAGEIVRRHRAAVLDYALLCCGGEKDAGDLTDETFAGTLREVRAGRGPTSAWRPYLVAAARRTAARWADTGREAALSAGFTAWLQGLPGADGRESAAMAAEEDSGMLRAFRILPEPSQAVLWHSLVEQAWDEAPLPDAGPGADPDTAGPSDALARQQLYEAYLRTYAVQAPSRACRHLIAVMDDTVRGGACDRTEDLDQHTDACESCSRVRDEITAIHTGQLAVVSEAVLLPTAIGPVTPPGNAGTADPDPEPTPTPTPTAARTHGENGTPPPRGGSRWLHDARRRLPASPAAAAVVMVATAATVVAVATVITTTVADHDTAGQGSIVTEQQSTTTAAPTASATTPAPTASSKPPSPTASSATPTPTRVTQTAKPPTDTPSPTVDPGPVVVSAGFQLVNRRSGLCVGVEGDDGADGAMLQLQQCTSDSTTQRWERIAAGRNRYQLRNTGTGKCLDGTHDSGNVVRVVERDCRTSTDRDAQLWTFQPDSDSSAYLLWFVPQVDSSDYSSHLLGPEEWTNSNPPQQGSYLAHLPNYYNSDSFLFTMSDGG